MNNDELILKLTDRLEEAGYRGIDVNIKESLFGYGMVAKKFKDHYFVLYCYYIHSTGQELRFGYTRLDFDEIKKAVDEMKEGFFDFMGTNKADYKEVDDISKIFDINQYNGSFNDTNTYQYYIEDVLRWNLESDGD